MANHLLLTLDFINDITHPKGKIAASNAFIEANQVIARANEAIGLARAKAIPIAHVKVGFSPNYIECPAHSPLFGKAKEFGALKLGSWGTEFHSDLHVEKQDTVIIKHRVSALYATALETILRARQIETVVVCGVSTNVAVDSITRELHDRDYRIIVLKDACAAAALEIHEAALNTLARLAKVSTAQEWKSSFNR